jgi:molybdopterin/thiamine biosynthesis adenylyltransferase
MALSTAEGERYARQLVLPGFVPLTQEFLRVARVHVVGAGEVGGPALLYLAASGVGNLLVDDGMDVAPEDCGSWLYGADQVGQPRVFSAIEALRATSSFAKARPYSTGAEPTAALICAPWSGAAREAAERARLAGIPHVVAVVDGEGGQVVSVPPGAPCYSCASRPGSGAAARPGAGAAVGALAALELLQILAGVAAGPAGRRIDLVLGEPQARATARVPGCACGTGRAP